MQTFAAICSEVCFADKALQVMTEHGPMPVTVAEIKEEVMILDANHPLAGKDLTFALKLEEIAA